jgi:prepilin-type processing-associated H-X9-DG protein/prepilin-type N-terminal cleavage/methylation domain-containing protein
MRECAFLRTQSTAFSLIELLITLAIICVITALMLPGLRSARENARRIQCASNMHQLGIAFRLYQEDHGGRYPDPWVDGNQHWQAFLGTPSLKGNYLPNGWVAWNPVLWGTRIISKFLCPTIVREYADVLDWGYCLNVTRTEISYGANDWPWYLPQLMNVDLNALYQKPARQAVLTDGNGASWAGPDGSVNWDATKTYWNGTHWWVRPIHGEKVNVLFMDAHVEPLGVSTPAEQLAFNRVWYGGIPNTAPTPINPYAND